MSAKDNTPSSETSHNPTRRGNTHSLCHYLSLFQQRDESVYYTLQSVHVSDRLHLLSYHSSRNQNSRTLIHFISPFPYREAETVLEEESTTLFQCASSEYRKYFTTAVVYSCFFFFSFFITRDGKRQLIQNCLIQNHMHMTLSIALIDASMFF